MQKKHATILMIAIGVLVVGVVLCVAAAAWFYTSAYQALEADEAQAVRSFDEVRARFKGTQPILELRDDEPVLLRKAPEATPARDLHALQVLSWNPDAGKLSRVTLPFWLLRMKSSSVDLPLAGSGQRLSLTAEDIERYGPSLFLDFVDDDGRHVLVWTE